MNRRHFLAGTTASLSLLAGCLNLLSSNEEGTDTPTDTATPTATGTSTATTSPTTTATPTATGTPTATTSPTTTAASTATPMPTTTGTSTTTGTTGAVIDPSNLETYTNQQESYSVKYPAGWTSSTTSKSNNSTTVFISLDGLMIAQVIYGSAQTQYNVAENPDKFIDQYLGIVFGDPRILNKQNVSLPNGHTGTVIEFAGEGSKRGGEKRGKVVYTVVNGNIYLVMVTVSSDAYTPTVEKGVETILTSLTIS